MLLMGLIILYPSSSSSFVPTMKLSMRHSRKANLCSADENP